MTLAEGSAVTESLAKLAELGAKQEIQALILRAMHAMDRCDVELLASTQRLDRSHPSYRPSQEAEHVIQAVQRSSRSSMHFVGTSLIDVDGDTAAGQTAYVSFLVQDQDGVDHLRSRGARRLQHFRRIDGRWYITATATVSDWSRFEPLGAPIPSGTAGLLEGARGREDPAYRYLPARLFGAQRSGS